MDATPTAQTAFAEVNLQADITPHIMDATPTAQTEQEHFFRKLSKKIGNDWQTVATYCSTSLNVIEVIKEENKDDVKQMPFQMLCKLSQRCPKTWEEMLRKALRKMERNDLVQEVLNFIKQLPTVIKSGRPFSSSKDNEASSSKTTTSKCQSTENMASSGDKRPTYFPSQGGGPVCIQPPCSELMITPNYFIQVGQKCLNMSASKTISKALSASSDNKGNATSSPPDGRPCSSSKDNEASSSKTTTSKRQSTENMASSGNKRKASSLPTGKVADMATAKPVTALKGLMKCSICTETFTTPKILDCFHFFCEDCLKRRHRSSGTPMIICPLCHKETRLPEKGVEGLNTNFHIVRWIDEVTLLNKTTSGETCEQCHDDNEATHQCIDCSQNICQTCLDIHKRISALSTHVTASLEDIRQGKVQMKRKEVNENRCHIHEGEVQRFYCETCEELICRDCTVIKHREHHFIEYKEAANEGKRELKIIFPYLHKVMKELGQSIASTSQVRQEFSKNVTQTKTKVQEAAAKVIAKVKAEEKRLIDDIEQLEQSRIQTFDDNDKTAIDTLQIVQHSVETAEGLTETPSDWTFLSVYPIIKKDLKSLTSCGDIPKTDQALSCLMLSQKSQLVGDLDLGKLVVEDTKWELGLKFGEDETNDVIYGDVCFLEPDKIV